MNISEIARRLKISTEELRAQLPALGFSIGARAIQVNDREGQKIAEAWLEMKKRERLTEKRDVQMAKIDADGKVKEVVVELKPVELPAVISVRDFATRLNMPIAKVMQELLKNGILASLNERIDFDTAAVVASDLGFAATMEASTTEVLEEEAGSKHLADVLASEETADRVSRPPVIVVMGHVDHGKTKILDSIRSTSVMESEAGGITQHIGAYQVVRNDKLITFIDTPGHEAFTVMRSRGAKVADIAILVVAADDGVKPQTKEAADIIKASGLPYVVAINKIDKPEANVEKVKGELAELNLIPEEWGGKTMIVPVSAKTGQGIDALLDLLLLVNEMEAAKISANPKRRAIGTIIESHIDKGAGPVATVLVQSGTLRVGDSMGVHGALFGKVRSMKDWRGELVTIAPPSMPVEVLGFKSAPSVGDVMEVPEDAKALEKMKERTAKSGVAEQTTVVRAQTGEEAKEKKMLNIIIRADVLGSLEALLGMLEKIKHDLVGVEVVSKGLGNVTDADILKADATHSVVYAFTVKATPGAEDLAREKNVDLVSFNIIYKLFEDVLTRLGTMLPAQEIITPMASAEVLAIFKKTDRGGVIGGKVQGDKLRAPCKMRVLRGEQVIGEGEIIKIQVGKQQVKEVAGGAECGLEFTGKVKIEVGDIIETYTEEQKERVLKIEGIDLR